MSKSLKKLIDINRLREFKNKLVGAGSAYVQTSAVDQTIAGTKTFSKPIVGSVTGSSGSCTGNAATATKATQDSAGQQIDTTYIKGLSVSGRTITYTKGDNTTGTITTQDTNTDTKVTQTVTTTNAEYPVLFSADANKTATSTTTARFSSNIKINPSTNTVTATTFKGNLVGNLTGNVTGNASTATTAATAKACTGNAATATKLATARTIALSGGATGTATKFDGSGNITIPVTALSPSAIRAQWYAAYPDGPEAHNAMWGGRDITAAFNNGTVSANIKNGTFKDIFPGDYITKSVTISGKTYTVNWVVTDCDYWINKGDKGNSVTAHHVAIVPQTPIFDARMNPINTTEGGYAGSEMYKKIIPACATGIVSAFGSDHILTFRDAISDSVDTSHVSSGIPQLVGTPVWFGVWMSVQCNLMSEKMVYGAPVFSGGAMDNTMATRQMSAFRLSEKLINYNCITWWLRDVVSSTYFAVVSGHGHAIPYNASSAIGGVRPFALLV